MENEAIHVELGARLRRYRHHRKLTLEDVAKHAGISASHLSMLERGRSSASISVARRLAASLGIPMSYLFETEDKIKLSPLRKQDRPLLDSDPGAQKYLITRPPLKSIEVYAGEFIEGASTGHEDYVHGDSQELLIVEQGEVELLLDGTPITLCSGDSIEFRSSMPHKITNIFPGESHVLWVVSPPTE
jgi:transcriptional regulator with XRE-family HTH domain